MNFTYCRLEIHKHFFSPNNSLKLKQEQSFIGEDNLMIYPENFDDYKILKKRILQLTKIWFSDFKSSSEREYPSFLIYNNRKEFARISFTKKGWLPPTTHFYGYLLRYLVNIHGEKDFRIYLNEFKGEDFLFVGPEWDRQSVNDIELVSEETINVLLVNFFETRLSSETLKQTFEQELIEKKIIT